MTPGTYNFSNHLRGDTLSSITMILTQTVGGVTTPIDLTGAVIRCMFRKTVSSPVALTISTDNGYITIVDPSNGEIRTEPVVLNMDAADYLYDMEFTFPSGEKKTFIKGTITIEADITR